MSEDNATAVEGVPPQGMSVYTTIRTIVVCQLSSLQP